MLSTASMILAGAKADDEAEALFLGRLPLIAKIRQHENNLPPEVVVCSHCHLTPLAVKTTPGIRLDRAYLMTPQQRRGGPPSSYDEAKFCRLLRTGVDPAYVLISRQMPVYSVSEEQCAQLWRFVINDGKR